MIKNEKTNYIKVIESKIDWFVDRLIEISFVKFNKAINADEIYR